MDSQKIARLLPAVFQRTLPADLHRAADPLAALLTLMEALQQPAEEALANLHRSIDAYDAPEAWVYYLASWLDLEPLFRDSSLSTEYHFAGGIGRLRELIHAAIPLANQRGTFRGLQHFLQIATGLEQYRIAEDPPIPFHILVYYPPEAVALLPLIRRIVQLEKPAYVTYELLALDDWDSQ